MTGHHAVFIVDDACCTRKASSELLASPGIRTVVFGSAGDCINAEKPDVPACLIAGHGDIPSAGSAITRGAVDLLSKPFSDANLMTAIPRGLDQDRKTRAECGDQEALRQRYSEFTQRKRQVDFVPMAERLEIPITHWRRTGGHGP